MHATAKRQVDEGARGDDAWPRGLNESVTKTATDWGKDPTEDVDG
jgi:hypothetical protein